MKKLVLFLLLLGAAGVTTLESCSKNSFITAVVRADGDELVDGCGWLLEIGENRFYPENLRNEDKVDGKVIEIIYTVSAVPYTCVNGKQYAAATITQIK